MAQLKEFIGKVKPDWCAGCGDFAVLNSLQKALAELDVAPHNVLVVSGIGCSSNIPGFINAYGFHGLHGRSLPVATGAKFGNTDLTVIAAGGDGDGYGIGVGHFVHTCRRNVNMTYIVMDNQTYGLTTGQASPTTEKDLVTRSTPDGSLEVALSPVALALTCGATYVARGFSGDNKHLADLMRGAIEHKGFALVDVFSPCVTYNKHNTYPWFRERVYKLEDERHDTSDFRLAMEKAFEWGARIPIGLLYKVERPTYEDEDVALREGPPLAKRALGQTNLAAMMEDFL